MRWQRSVPCLLVFLALHVDARDAWEWNDDERLAQRFDPTAIRARAAFARRDSHAGRAIGAHGNEGELPNVINGQRNPELFLPHELFAQLVMTALIDDNRGETRQRLMPLIEETHGDASSFWVRLEAASAPYIAILARERALAAQLSAASGYERADLQQELEAIQMPQCSARAEALNAAAQAIGKPVLYRVLYKAIAPEMSVTSGPGLTAEGLRFIAGGCR